MADSWDRPATRQETEAVERERAYWEEHEDLDWVTESSKEDVIALMPPLEGDVLELCIGSGTFTRALPDTYASYTGVDISRSLLDTLLQSMPEVLAVHGNAEQLEFGPERFDSVLVFAGLHHLPRYRRSLAESWRVLRPGGTFFCFEPNARAWYRTPMRFMRDFIGIYSDDEVYLDPRVVGNTMEELGFTDLRMGYLTPRFKPAHLTRRNRLLASMMYGAAALGTAARSQSFFTLSGRKPDES